VPSRIQYAAQSRAPHREPSLACLRQLGHEQWSLPWDQFTRRAENRGDAECGNVHWPPNTLTEYAYYMQWWIQHLPHREGTLEGFQTNWQRYIFDYRSFM